MIRKPDKIILILLLFAAKNVLAEVKINEVFFNPKGNDTGKEWIELYNNGVNDANIGGFELNATSGDYFQFPNNTIIPPHNFILIWWRKNGGNASNEFFTTTNGFTSNMGNSYGWIALFKNSKHNKDSIIDYIEYGKGGRTWESAAANAKIWQKGNFISINKIENITIGRKTNGTDQNNPSDWQEFSSPTPNYSNNGATPTPPQTSSKQTTPAPIPTKTPKAMPAKLSTPAPNPMPPITPSTSPRIALTPAPTPQNSPTTTPRPSTTPIPSAPVSNLTNSPQTDAKLTISENPKPPINNSIIGIIPELKITANQTTTTFSGEEKLISDPKEIERIKNREINLSNSLVFKPINAIINMIKSLTDFILKLFH